MMRYYYKNPNCLNRLLVCFCCSNIKFFLSRYYLSGHIFVKIVHTWHFTLSWNSLGTFIRIILTSSPTFLPMSQGLQNSWFRAVRFLLNFDNVDINKAVNEHFCIIQASQLLAMHWHAIPPPNTDKNALWNACYNDCTDWRNIWNSGQLSVHENLHWHILQKIFLSF